MSHLGYHIRLRLKDGRVIAKTDAQRREVARVVLAQSRSCNLLAMNLADSHLHLESACERKAAGRLTHRIESSLKQRLHLPVGFVQYEPVPIHDHRQLHNTFRYVLAQTAHHGLPTVYALEGSNAPDLLGLRLVGRHSLTNVQRWLPRVTRADILQWTGLPAAHPANGPLHRIEEATLAATCLQDLRGGSQATVAARRAMVAVIGTQLTTEQIAELLGRSQRSVRWLRSRPADPLLVEAIRLQLGMRSLVI